MICNTKNCTSVKDGICEKWDRPEQCLKHELGRNQCRECGRIMQPIRTRYYCVCGNSRFIRGNSMENLFEDVRIEVERAREKFPSPDHLLHALTEEHGEVVKESLNIFEGKGSYQNQYTEIVQCMAMCVRLFEEGDPMINLKPCLEGMRCKQQQSSVGYVP